MYAHCLFLKLAIRAVALYFNGVQMWTMYLYSLRHGTLDSDLLNVSLNGPTQPTLFCFFIVQKEYGRSRRG